MNLNDQDLNTHLDSGREQGRRCDHPPGRGGHTPTRCGYTHPGGVVTLMQVCLCFHTFLHMYAQRINLFTTVEAQS